MKDIIPTDTSNVHISLLGHSLGGSDAQRTCELNRRFQEFSDSAISKIDHIDVHIWNSPGISHSTNTSFLDSERDNNHPLQATEIYEEDDSFTLLESIHSDNPVTIIVIVSKNEGDPIQQCGESF